jgi:hypothetical protein
MRLLKVALEARFLPELARLAALPRAAAAVAGFPDWEATHGQIRLINRESHCGLLLTHREARYIQDTGCSDAASSLGNCVSAELLHALNVAHVTRAGRRTWYVHPVHLAFQELVDAFRERYAVANDPAGLLGHQVADTVYRIVSSDPDGYRWNLAFAPVPREQLVQLLGYNWEAHWPADAWGDRQAAIDSLPEVALFADLDCYREGEMTPGNWSRFVRQSAHRCERAARKLFDDFLSRETA